MNRVTTGNFVEKGGTQVVVYDVKHQYRDQKLDVDKEPKDRKFCNYKNLLRSEEKAIQLPGM